MHPDYEAKVSWLESSLSRWARRSNQSLGRKYGLKEDDYRTPFERDCHRVLHSLPFRRLKHKTQVFFAPRDDHICTRMEHSLHVASISVTICKRLDFNSTLAEAIALAHDLGHPPFGHLGEKALDSIHQSYNRKNPESRLSSFRHEAQSLRVIDNFRNEFHDRLDLTYEVRDGVVCHCGEKSDKILNPDYKKDLRAVETSAARRSRPATIEGCVVRMADTISYLGRDFEDACVAGFTTPEELPPNTKETLGTTNSAIIGTLVNDIVANSAEKPYLEFSDKVFGAMVDLKDFNYQKVYKHIELLGQEKRIFLILNELFQYFLSVLTVGKQFETTKEADKVSYYHKVFSIFLKDMGYAEDENKAQMVSDFVAGMTDNFAMRCFESLFQILPVV